ncbi:MAG: hypothetical protein WA063_03150 [Minisyncoccia bacterium]
MNINLKESLKKIKFSFCKKPEKNRTNYHKKKIMPILASLFLVIIFIAIPIHEARAGLLDPLIDILAGGVGLIIYNVMNLALFVTVGIVHFGAYLVDIMTDPVLYETVLDSNSVAIRTGWTTIRDFCNMFFIFFLLVVAFATILRISAYSAKAILPKFLIAIFMINFSQEITKMVIDFGQVFMYEFISWMGGSFSGSGGGGTALTSIADFFYNKYHFGYEYNFDAVLSISFAVAYTLALGYIYIILAGFLLVRLIAFVVLIIFSPFAIFAMVFPGTRKYTSEWWSGLIKYTMFGPIFMFFVYLSSVMAMDLQSSTDLSASITGGGGYSGLSLGDILIELIPNVIALGLLLAAIPMSQKLGGIAGAAALTGGGLGGLGTAVMGSYAGAKLAGGWGKKVAGGLDNRVLGGRGSQIGRDIRDKAYKKLGMSGTILVKAGELQKDKEDKMKKTREKYGTPSENIDLDTAVAVGNKSGASLQDKAYAMEVISAHGKLADPKYAKAVKDFTPAAEEALNSKELKAVSDKSLQFAASTKDGKKRISEIGLDHGRTAGLSEEAQGRLSRGETSNEEEFMREKMAGLIREGKAHEVQDLDHGLSAKAWKESQTSDQLKATTSRMTEEQRAKLQKGYMTNTIEAPDYAATKTAALGGDADAIKKLDNDMKFKIEAVNAGKSLTEAFSSGGVDAASHIEKAFKKFDAKRVGKFSETELRDHGHNATMSQVRTIFRDGKEDEVKEIRKQKDNKFIATGDAKYEKERDNIDSLISGSSY